MDERKPERVMAESNNLNGSQRRRSPRLSSPLQANVNVKNDKMALAPVSVKRSIMVRKIAPRKTAAPSEHNKKNTPRRSGTECSQQKKPQVSTPGSVPERGRSSSAKKKAVVPSPILPSSPTHSGPQQPAVEPGDAEWSQKVRRSYSRLSDKSSNSPDARETLFGFDQLKTPEVVRSAKPSKTRLELSRSLSALNSFTSLLEENDCGSALLEQDPNIPGLAVVREKRRRRRVRQIDDAELDAMAAQMNAEFEEAEVFELVVE